MVSLHKSDGEDHSSMVPYKTTEEDGDMDQVCFHLMQLMGRRKKGGRCESKAQICLSVLPGKVTNLIISRFGFRW